MPQYVIDTLKPKNNNNFPVAEAVDVLYEEGSTVKDKIIAINALIVAAQQLIEGVQTDISELQSSKVDKVSGKDLSTNDFTNAYRDKIDDTYTKSETDTALAGKVDKVSGKGLSTNDFDNKYKSKVDNTYSKSETDSKFKDKVDKVEGKGLSTNDFTNDYQKRVHDAYAKAAESISEVERLKSNKADKTALDETNEAVAVNAANQKNLQGQIDALVLEAGGDSNAEVVQARVGLDGKNHATLKSRLDIADATIATTQNELKSLNDSAVFTEVEEGTEELLFRFDEGSKLWQTQTSSISDGIARVDISNATSIEISAFFIANDLYATFEFLDENNEHISWGNTYSDGITPDFEKKWLYDYTIPSIPSNAKYIRVVKFNNNSASDNFYVKLSYSIKGKVGRIQTGLSSLDNQVRYNFSEHSEVEEGTEELLFRFDEGWQTQTSSISDGIARVDISNALIIEISAFFIANKLYATYEFLDENSEHVSWGNTYSDGITPDSEKKWLYDYTIPSIPSNAKYIRVVKFNNNSASDNFYVKVYGVKGKFNEIHSQINRIDNEITDIRSSINEFDYNRVLKVAELPKNKKFDLFVFSGQSNMMGASAIPPKSTEETLYSYEYKYNPKLKGATRGDFENSKHSAGEWSYKDVDTAYSSSNIDANGKSLITDYSTNTFFVSAISNGNNDGTVDDFESFSESTARLGSSIAPCVAREYASYGSPCVYAHMAKGSVGIDYYLDSDVQAFFANKVNSMTQDFASVFNDCSIKSKNFIWCQGETDGNNGMSKDTYKTKLSQLWAWLQGLGFQNFFCVRVGYWGKESIKAIMQAQEEFCNENNNCYIITRAMSYMLWPGQETSNWFTVLPDAETYGNCRDSYYGYNNNHINEKGHSLVAKIGAYNINRVLNEKQQPELETERINGI